MALTRDEVRAVALLAQLRLTDEQLGEHARHINNLLERVARMGELNLDGVPPASDDLGAAGALRDDAATPSLDRADLLANAPEAANGAFVTPRILDAG